MTMRAPSTRKRNAISMTEAEAVAFREVLRRRYALDVSARPGEEDEQDEDDEQHDPTYEGPALGDDPDSDSASSDESDSGVDECSASKPRASSSADPEETEIDKEISKPGFPGDAASSSSSTTCGGLAAVASSDSSGEAVATDVAELRAAVGDVASHSSCNKENLDFSATRTPLPGETADEPSTAPTTSSAVAEKLEITKPSSASRALAA